MMQCFSCRAEYEIEAGDRVGFHETCDPCGRDLHVCLNCALHDTDAYNECRESSSERVSDRERANRCEYFRPIAEGADGVEGEGGAAEGRGQSLGALEALFRKD